MEKKTIEEAAESYANEYYEKDSQRISVTTDDALWNDVRFNFKAGAEWYANNQWISVEDRLPEDNENVLCYNGYRIVDNSYSMYTDQDQFWFKKRFTHWMYIPALPSLHKQ